MFNEIPINSFIDFALLKLRILSIIECFVEVFNKVLLIQSLEESITLVIEDNVNVTQIYEFVEKKMKQKFNLEYFEIAYIRLRTITKEKGC